MKRPKIPSCLRKVWPEELMRDEVRRLLKKHGAPDEWGREPALTVLMSCALEPEDFEPEPDADWLKPSWEEQNIRATLQACAWHGLYADAPDAALAVTLAIRRLEEEKERSPEFAAAVMVGECAAQSEVWTMPVKELAEYLAPRLERWAMALTLKIVEHARSRVRRILDQSPEQGGPNGGLKS